MNFTGKYVTRPCGAEVHLWEQTDGDGSSLSLTDMKMRNAKYPDIILQIISPCYSIFYLFNKHKCSLMSLACCASTPTGSSQRYSPSAVCGVVIYEAPGHVSRWCMSLRGVVSQQVESLLSWQQRDVRLLGNWSAELKQEAHRSWYLMFNERRLMFNTTDLMLSSKNTFGWVTCRIFGLFNGRELRSAS